MELHFYPGRHLLVVTIKGKATERFEAWGGPAKMGTDPAMAEEPTWPGTYVIGMAQAYRTSTWPFSKIKWGTPLRDMRSKKDVWYKLSGDKWGSVLNDTGISRHDVIERFDELYGHHRVPTQWVFNDFGPIAVRWFKDLNANLILDGEERLSGQMFHTTPENEAEKARGQPLLMTPSHGCIHIKPTERDRLFAMGAFNPKTLFFVHKYDEHP